MSEWIASRTALAVWAGRLADWRRRHRLHIAAAAVFTVTCLLGMAVSALVIQAMIDAVMAGAQAR
jgi:hypothetical protein